MSSTEVPILMRHAATAYKGPDKPIYRMGLRMGFEFVAKICAENNLPVEKDPRFASFVEWIDKGAEWSVDD
jgi:hypothetical protein